MQKIEYLAVVFNFDQIFLYGIHNFGEILYMTDKI